MARGQIGFQGQLYLAEAAQLAPVAQVVAASVWVAFGAGLALTPLGLGWVMLQALAVLVLAELEWSGSRTAQRQTGVMGA